MASFPTLSEIQDVIDSQDFNAAKVLLNKVVESPSSPLELMQISKLYQKIQDFQSSRKILESTLSTSQDPQVLQMASDQLQDIQMNLKGKEEYEEFGNLCKSSPLLEGSLWHIVSKNWLTAWENSILWGQSAPGVISNKDLIDDTEVLIDPRPHKKYTNLMLKTEVSEKVHYELVPKSAYTFLQQRYSEDQTVLKRWCISLADDGSGLHIEIRLKPISIIIIPSNPSPCLILMSRIETITNLKEKIASIFPELQKLEFRAWVSYRNENFKDLSASKKHSINGKLINEKTMIEDCEIAENNLIVAEFKHKGEWVLFRADEICKYCKNSGSLKNCSVCKIVKYCSRECQVNDYKEHKEICRKVVETKNLSSGLVGFQNLGFTCFMNSALQCTIHTKKLRDYFLYNEYQKHLNTNNPLGTTNAALARVFADLIDSVWKRNESVIAPWAFKKVISKFAPQFIGYDQHDAHELLTYLLSGLHEDLNQIVKKPYVEKPECENLPDPEASLNSWNWFLLRNKSLLVDLMYGQLKSSLKCPKCQKQSFTFDPFLTLSVNIPNTRRIAFSVKVVNKRLQIVKQRFVVFANTSVGKVKNLICNKFSVKKLIIFYYNGLNVQGICDENYEICEYLKKKLVAYEWFDDLKSCSLLFLKIAYMENESKVISGFNRMLFLKKSDSFKKVHKYLKQQLPPGFSVNIVNCSGYSGFFNKSRLPCVFCGDCNCNNCPLPRSNMTLHEAGEKLGADAQLTLELIYPNALDCNSITVVQKTEEISDNFISNENLSLVSCIEYTMNPETLDSQNEWYCSGCKSHVQALKTLQLYILPEILIIHLIRFKIRGIFSQKNTDFVDFPIENLEFNSQIAVNVRGKYDLYAVCNHYGGLGGGHYTATVLSNDGWYDLDDSKVSRLSPDKVVTAAAYILFYKLKNS